MLSSENVMFVRVALPRPKALAMTEGQAIGKLRLPLPPVRASFDMCKGVV